MCLALFPNACLMQSLQEALQNHRQTEKIEADADAQLDKLEQELQHHRRALDRVCKRNNDTKHSPSDGASTKQSSSCNEASELRKLVRQNECQQDQDQRRMNDVYNRLRDKQYKLFGDLEQLFELSDFVTVGLDGSDLSRASCPSGRSIGYMEGRPKDNDSGQTSCRIAEPMQRLNSEPKDPRYPDVAATNHGNQTNAQYAELAPNTKPADTDQGAGLLYHLQSIRALLHCAEYDLDNRQEEFERQIIEHDRRARVGEHVASATELDLHFFKETQRLTRRLIELEELHDTAKADALAAGVQLPWSDVESGFIDDEDDGYRLSFEKEMQDTLDSVRIHAWLNSLETAGLFDAQDPSISDHRGGSPDKDEDTDDWKSVDMQLEYESRRHSSSSHRQMEAKRHEKMLIYRDPTIRIN